MTTNKQPLSLSDLIQRVNELDKAATPGPWWNDHYAKKNPGSGVGYTWGPNDEMIADQCPECEGVRLRGVGARLPQEQNGDFIAESRTLLVQLAAEAQRLQVELREQKGLADLSDEAHYEVRKLLRELVPLSPVCAFVDDDVRNAILTVKAENEAREGRVAELEGQIEQMRQDLYQAREIATAYTLCGVDNLDSNVRRIVESWKPARPDTET